MMTIMISSEIIAPSDLGSRAPCLYNAGRVGMMRVANDKLQRVRRFHVAPRGSGPFPSRTAKRFLIVELFWKWTILFAQARELGTDIPA